MMLFAGMTGFFGSLTFSFGFLMFSLYHPLSGAHCHFWGRWAVFPWAPEA
jgi:hypothetical protein